MLGKVKESIDNYDVSNISQIKLAEYYLQIPKLPILIHSPLREDKHASFGLYCPKKDQVNYIDYSTGDRGNMWSLLKNLWNCSWQEVRKRVYFDLVSKDTNSNISTNSKRKVNKLKILKKNTKLEVQTRDWKNHDIAYWKSYGINVQSLKAANVYPVKHKIIYKDNNKIVLKAPDYCYAFFEFKEHNTTIKIYQPFSKTFKWTSTHDHSVISLWTKLPKTGDKVCICSSLKDALCLWINMNIPSIAIQGEGYDISNTVIKELKERFKYVFICLDCDKPGLKMAQKLQKRTGFINVVLGNWGNQKDISDFYKYCLEKRKDISLFKKYINIVFEKAIILNELHQSNIMLE